MGNNSKYIDDLKIFMSSQMGELLDTFKDTNMPQSKTMQTLFTVLGTIYLLISFLSFGSLFVPPYAHILQTSIFVIFCLLLGFGSYLYSNKIKSERLNFIDTTNKLIASIKKKLECKPDEINSILDEISDYDERTSKVESIPLIVSIVSLLISIMAFIIKFTTKQNHIIYLIFLSLMLSIVLISLSAYFNKQFRINEILLEIRGAAYTAKMNCKK